MTVAPHAHSIYRLCHAAFSPWKLHCFIQNWMVAQPEWNLVPKQREFIFFFTHKSSISSWLQESGYMILLRWYRVPKGLHCIIPNMESNCWRGTLLKIFWLCPQIHPFSQGDCTLIQELTGLTLEQDPAACLLHLSLLSKSKYPCSLVRHLNNAVRECILAW